MTEHGSLHFPEIRTLADTLPFHAARQPAQAALISADATLTYAALNGLSNQSARALQSLGLPPFSRVAYLGRESACYYELLFACAKSAMVLVPINWRLTAEEVKHILRDSLAAVILVEASFLPLLDSIAGELGALRTIVTFGDEAGDGRLCLDDWRRPCSAENLTHRALPDDPVAQLYTSGTTGLPKGVVLAHRSFHAVRDALASTGQGWIDWRPGDVSLIGIPGFHVGGLWWSTQGFNAGITNVSMPTFFPARALELVREHRITALCVVPAMIQMMLSEHGVTSADFASVRKVVYGGSPISETLLTEAIRVLQCELAQIYGLTETGNTAVCLPPEVHVPGDPRLRAAGRPYPGFRLKIIDDSGAELPPNAVGEICIFTPARMIEYWRLPEATAETLIDGWIHTGDAGYLDEEGYVYVCDRLKDMVIVAGENIYPAEVENALCKLPEVEEAAVIGVPDERWGEALVAFVVLRGDRPLTPREVRMALKGVIADYKIPARYEFIPRVPRNPSGKILRRVLRDELQKAQEPAPVV